MDPALHVTLRAAMALLLGSAAWHKLRDYTRFRDVLAGYVILPAALVPAAARLVPVLEATLGAAVAWALLLPFTGTAVALLMLAYAAAIFVNVRRGRTGIDCGCTGPGFHVPLGAHLVARNLVLAAAAAMLVLPVTSRAMTWFDAVAAIASTMALSACWLAIGRLLALAPRVDELRRRMA